MSMERNNVPEQEQEQYSFLQEKIKGDTFDRKKALHKVLKTVGAGFIFGIAASIGFCALKPWAETKFQKDPTQVTIPKDAERNDNIEEKNVEKPVPQVLTVESYRELNYALRQVVMEAEKSIVEVIGIQNSQDWTAENTAGRNSVSGVIVADNGQELLILADTSVLRDVKGIKVKFADDAEYHAVLKERDNNIGLAIFSVSKREIRQETWAKIKVAQLGNSNVLLQGSPLIALGSPFGFNKGIGYGVFSTADYQIVRADGEYNILVTDIPGNNKGSGALFDVDGKVVGILQHSLMNVENNGVLTAFGISSIKNEIELMSNGKEVPYVGIIGAMVTDEVSKTQNIPKGLYVIEVEADSPALKAGIQSGDVLTHIGEEEITSLKGYRTTMIGYDIGREIALTGRRRGAEEYVEIGFTVTAGMKE